jgi:putative oxidoreductase
MDYGLLLLRVVVGLTMFAHGSQKLFGWFGGGGLGGTSGWLGSMGFRPPGLLALAVAAAESSGLLLALGLLTPLGSLGIASAMFVAVMTVHLSKGYFVGNGGFEYNLVLAASAVAVAATGPGRFSLDRAFHADDNWSGLWWGVGALVLAVVLGSLVLTVFRSAPPPQEPAPQA